MKKALLVRGASQIWPPACPPLTCLPEVAQLLVPSDHLQGPGCLFGPSAPVLALGPRRPEAPASHPGAGVHFGVEPRPTARGGSSCPETSTVRQDPTPRRVCEHTHTHTRPLCSRVCGSCGEGSGGHTQKHAVTDCSGGGGCLCWQNIFLNNLSFLKMNELEKYVVIIFLFKN